MIWLTNDECSYTYLFYIQTSHTIYKYVYAMMSIRQLVFDWIVFYIAGCCLYCFLLWNDDHRGLERRSYSTTMSMRSWVERVKESNSKDPRIAFVSIVLLPTMRLELAQFLQQQRTQRNLWKDQESRPFNLAKCSNVRRERLCSRYVHTSCRGLICIDLDKRVVQNYMLWWSKNGCGGILELGSLVTI